MGAASIVVKMLRCWIHPFHRNGARLVLAGVRPGPARVPDAAGITESLGLDGLIIAEGALFAPLEQAPAQSR